MAHSTLVLVSPVGKQMERPVGFSWTTLFFGAWVPLLRGDWKLLAIMIVLSCVTCGLSGFVFPFIYNKMSFKKAMEDGYTYLRVKEGRPAEQLEQDLDAKLV